MDDTGHKVANAGIICMAMVVGIHVITSPPCGTALWWWNSILSRGIFQIAVPFYFVCSGFFIARKTTDACWFKVAIKRRIRSLLIPYLLWSGVFLALPFVLVGAENFLCGRSIGVNMLNLHVDLLRGFGIELYSTPLLYPLWYVRALMLFVIVSPLILCLLKNKYCAMLLVCIIYLLWGVFSLGFCQPRITGFFQCFFSLRGLFWFVVGFWIACFSKHANKVACKLCKLRWLILFCGFVGLGLSVWASNSGGGGVNRCFELLFVPLLLASLWSFAPSCPFPKWLTASSFLIFILHPIVWQCCLPVYGFPVNDIGGWLLKWLVGFAGAMLLGRVMWTTLPHLSSVLFGGRGAA